LFWIPDCVSLPGRAATAWFQQLLVVVDVFSLTRFDEFLCDKDIFLLSDNAFALVREKSVVAL